MTDLWQVRDTLCSLMPADWDEKLMLASDHADNMRSAIEGARTHGGLTRGAAGGGLTSELVATYMLAVSDQVRALCTEGRLADLDRWLSSTLHQLPRPDDKLPATYSGKSQIWGAVGV